MYHETSQRRKRTIPIVILLMAMVWFLLEWSARQLWNFSRWLMRRVHPKITTHHQDADCAYLAKLLFQKLSDYRTSQGLPALRWNERLERVALRQSQRLEETGELYHLVEDEASLRLRLQSQGYAFQNCREVFMQSGMPDASIEQHAEIVHKRWQQTCSDNRHLVAVDIEELGIGTVKSGESFIVVLTLGKQLATFEYQVCAPAPAPRRASHRPPNPYVHTALAQMNDL